MLGSSLAVALAWLIQISGAPPTNHSEDERAIREHVAAYVDAYNAHDSGKMDALFTDDADTVVLPGRLLTGVAALHDLFIRRHSTIAKSSQLARTVEHIRFLKPDLAVVDGTYEATGMLDDKGAPAPPLRAWVTEVLAKERGVWRGVVFRAIPLSSAPSPATTDRPTTHRIFRIGMLSDAEFFGNPISPQDWLAAFRAGLNEAGYREGENIQLEFRNADRDLKKLAEQAVELAAMKPDVIVASSTTAAKAAKAATDSVPIVFWGAEPVSSGLVHDPDHPGGNLTGVTADDQQQKTFLEQLKDVVPGLDRVAILFNPTYAPVSGLLKYAEEGARALRLSTHLVKVAGPEDLPAAFADMKRAGCRAALALNHGMFFRERATLARLAVENGIALSTPYIRNAEAGVLIGHEADFDRVWRLNAGYVARILKGTRPGDLPLQRVGLRYGINLNTAKALGLTVPDSLLRGAAVVIPAGGGVEEEIRRLEEERRQALLNEDAAAMDRLLADPFITIDNRGRTHDRQDELSLYSKNRRTTTSWNASDVTVRVHGDLAVVTERVSADDAIDGQSRHADFRLTDVWVKQTGKWRVAARQGTPVVSPSELAVVPSADSTGRTIYPAPRDETDREVLSYWERMRQAWLNEDIKTIDQLFADDYQQITGWGSVRTKGEILSDHRAGAVRLTALDYRDLDLREYGDAAIVTGTVITGLSRDGHEARAAQRFTQVLVKGQHGWQAVANQASPPIHIDSASDTEREILALEDRSYGAALSGDLATVATLLDDSYVGINGSGAIFDKPAALELYRSGTIQIVSQRFDERRVRVFGDTAIVTGIWRFDSKVRGDPTSGALRFTHAWIRRAEGWKIVSWQGTAIATQPPTTAARSPREDVTPAAATNDENVVRALLTDYEAAWNRHDANALASFYTEDADAVFPSGAKASGLDAIRAAEAANHTSLNRRSQTTRTIRAIRFPTPDVAIADIDVHISGMTDAAGNTLPTRDALMTTVLVRRAGAWRIAANRAMVPASNTR